MLRIWLIGLIVVAGLWAEPSVYRNSGSSGVQIQRNKNAIFKLKQETERLREEIEGLRSIIEGLNRTVGRLQQKGSSRGEQKLLTDMSSLLDKINQEYVSKTELSKALKSGRIKTAVKKRASTAPKAKVATQGNNLNKAPSAALYSKGVRLVEKKRYTDARKRFDILASRGYKKAATHFYLGEIAYRTAHYTRAVDEYKQSAELNEKAGYMDKLLLHTGLSLQKNGDRAQAKRFFQAIVDGYPDGASAKTAKKYL